MSEPTDGGPAFGGEIDDVFVNTERPDLEPFKFKRRIAGMSLRDWFAGQAMQAMVTKSSGQDSTGGKKGVPLVAKYAYEYADAMLEARKR